jgi:formylglycine-generating enzyme required for sulfatase activity
VGTAAAIPGFNPEKILADFERAWSSGAAPALDLFLPSTSAIAPTAFRNLLCDLIPVDLEYRWCAHGPRTPGGAIPARPRIEDYRKVYALLGPIEQLPADLIAAEYRVRSWSGEPPKHEEYAARFPRQGAALKVLLAQIDGEMSEERARVERFVREAAPPPAEAVSAPVVASAALLDALRQHNILRPAQFDELARENVAARFPQAHALAQHLLERDWLTPFQVNALLHGKAVSLVLGPYLLLGRLGEGGMGRVYKARQRQLNRVVALKVFRKELLAELDAEAISRFYQEVEAVGRLSHPYVIHAYDAGPVGATHFLAMEYMESIDLGRLVKQNGPLPIAQACDFMRQAALGLQHAYERGLVHRDLKPSNLLAALPKQGEPLPPGASRWGLVKVLDLGLARLQLSEGVRSGHGLTLHGDVIGTPDYMAPEQGDDPHQADIRADLYSLGCTLYHLLTGKVPFAGGTFLQKINRHRAAIPVPVEQLRPEVPAPVAMIVRRLMAKRPAERIQTPAEVAAALTAVLEGRSLPPLPAAAITATLPAERTIADLDTVSELSSQRSLLEEPAPSSKRWLWLALAAGALGPMVLIAGVVVLLLLRPSAEKPKLRPGPAANAPEMEKLVTNSIGMKLTLIPAGKFTMGSPPDELGRRGDEGPPHEVAISRPFYLGVYEVTQEQYERVTGVNPSGFNRANAAGPEYPVETVSWDDAVAFCQKLSARTSERNAGRTYRLPTEAEWEYACRAGSKTPYYFTKGTLEQHAWFNVNSQQHTHPVGQRTPNPWGLHDMYGNVWEWTADYYGEHASTPAVDPRGPATGNFRVFRGGAWNDAATDLRSAHRYHYGVYRAQSNIGFRVACDITPRK